MTTEQITRPARRFARTGKRHVQRVIARSTVLRVVVVLAAFGTSLLPAWLRWLPVALVAIPGPLDELAFAVLVLAVVIFRPALRAALVTSLRLTVGARHLTAANERLA